MTGSHSIWNWFGDFYNVQTGTEQNDSLEAEGFFSKLVGLGGNDTFYGGGLFDKFYGGDGSDTVSYEYARCAVSVSLEKSGWQWTGGGKFDKLNGIENLTGSRYNDKLIGNSEDNRLVGGAGRDKMIGGDGNDIYSVDNRGDCVIEKADEGIDLVLSSISYKLGDNLENLALFDCAITGTGNELRNIIAGNDQDNIINGKGGHDTLLGGGGSDMFVFDAPDATSWDDINDFESGVDKLAFVGSAFGLEAGPLDPDYLVMAPTGGVAPDGTHNLATTDMHGQFIFDRYANLWWDADGSGDGAAVLLVGVSAQIAVEDIVIL